MIADAAAEEMERSIAAAGRRRFARWDDALFLAYVEYSGSWMRRQLEGAAGAAVYRGWLQVVAEGVGTGLLRPLEGDFYQGTRDQGILAWCLGLLAPRELPRLPAGERLAALARLWNACEGLAGMPAWIQGYARYRCQEDRATLADLPGFLERTLAPLLSDAPAAGWKGPLSASTLDLRDAHDHFLPGDIYPAAPAVVCVLDRRDPDAATAIFLRRGGQSLLMGPTPRLPRWDPPAPPPAAALSPGKIAIQAQSLDLPALAEPRGCAVLAAGFAVIAAEDSQRVWIVESA